MVKVYVLKRSARLGLTLAWVLILCMAISLWVGICWVVYALYRFWRAW